MVWPPRQMWKTSCAKSSIWGAGHGTPPTTPAQSGPDALAAGERPASGNSALAGWIGCMYVLIFFRGGGEGGGGAKAHGTVYQNTIIIAGWFGDWWFGVVSHASRTKDPFESQTNPNRQLRVTKQMACSFICGRNKHIALQRPGHALGFVWSYRGSIPKSLNQG